MFFRFLFPALILFLASCAGVAPVDTGQDKDKLPLILKSANFSGLEGWEGDDHAEALEALKVSCRGILNRDPARAFHKTMGGTIGDWQPACNQAMKTSASGAKTFFEENFKPWKATAGGMTNEGLFTGYYEASLNGSRKRHGPYQTALRLRPDDLVMVNLGEFRDELKGQRIAGRVKGGQLKPFESRAEIEQGKLPKDQNLTFLWVDDPVDAFFVQIQGSGVVTLDTGEAIRVGYAGQNGHPYYAIGRELVKRGEMVKDEVSLQSIRAWLKNNPAQAEQVMNTNNSYVFFRELDKSGPVGGEGVVLTPRRSLAVDRTKIGYGTPIWLQTAPPAEGQNKINRLMIAQDTGGAIRGPVRGDFFWGYGSQAEYLAGQMKSKGSYWLLLPKTIKAP